MTTVKRLLEKKGAAIWSISPHALVYEALGLMAEKNTGTGWPVRSVLEVRAISTNIIAKARKTS